MFVFIALNSIAYILFFYLIISLWFDKKKLSEINKNNMIKIRGLEKLILEKEKNLSDFLESNMKMVSMILMDHKSSTAFTKTVRVYSHKGSYRYEAIKYLYDFGYIKSAKIEGEIITADLDK